MPTIVYHRVNVFTTRSFGGNPLAVFPDADGLPDDIMQALAREVNLAESTFVQRSRAIGANVRVRIFTVAEEMPHAYKDVADVVEVMEAAGVSRRVAELRPLGVVKG